MPSRVLFGFLLIDLAAAALSHSDVCFQPHSKVMEDVNHGHQYLSACSSHLRQGKQIFGIGKEEILLLIGRSGRSLRCSDYGVHLSGWCKDFYFYFFFYCDLWPYAFQTSARWSHSRYYRRFFFLLKRKQYIFSNVSIHLHAQFTLQVWRMTSFLRLLSHSFRGACAVKVKCWLKCICSVGHETYKN